MKDNFIISSQHPLVKNHQVYGSCLLPGLAYIDILYQIFRAQGFHFSELELRDMSIHAPLTIEKDEEIEVQVDAIEQSKGQWDVVIEGRSRTDNSPWSDKKRYITARVFRKESTQFDEYLNIERYKANATAVAGLSDIYKKLRDIELVHTGFVKADGNVHVEDSSLVVELTLGQDASSNAEEFMFHPTLMDGSGVGASLMLSSVTDGQLFLPLFSASFRASSLLESSCYTRVKKSSLYRKDELLYMTLEFFDQEGWKVAELSDFVSKLVREPGLISAKHRSPGLMNKDNHQTSQIENETHAVNDTPGPERTSVDFELLVRQLIAEKLGVSANQIVSHSGYYELGMDSSSLLELVKDLENKLAVSLSPILLFEHKTISELSSYLQSQYGTQTEVFNIAESSLNEVVKESTPRRQLKNKIVSRDRDFQNEDVAIIGMAGRYPQANNLQEFWDNLVKGKDCITEIPDSRWNWREMESIYSPSGKPISRWGGFLSEPDRFDPQFFRISPREAEGIDPQERLFLEVCWEGIEDAGYTPATLVTPIGPDRRRSVGVFVGVMHKDYSLLGSDSVFNDPTFPLSLNYAPIPNRVSYFCDFHGPSMAVDTVCSSSLTAIHLALESIHRGESEVALAGGVNLSLHPAKYLSYGLMDMHSSDGRCRSFGDSGDGYVSGEGIGVVLLKPLQRALDDGDHIYALVKGSTINHGGTASGINVPNPVAQSAMIMDCLNRTGVSASSISYVEAHGTGTSLGDPIEMQGLTKAYSTFTSKRQYCAIGSVKSNIGHAESAAGIAGLMKVVLQLKHKTLVPSLHSEKLNHHINFEDTPFYVQQKAEPWQQLEYEDSGESHLHPRRAGLSSFGATGSNAHVIVEEYVPSSSSNQSVLNAPYIVLLSAKDEQRLLEYCSKLLNYLDSQSEPNLADIAYTLQVGRQAMEERLALLVDNLSDLIEKLESFVGRNGEVTGIYRGHASSSRTEMTNLLEDEDMSQVVSTWIKKGKYGKLLEFWVKGLDIDWLQLYGELRPARISLPTYPFAKEHYWLPVTTRPSIISSPTNRKLLHPLVHENSTDFYSGLRFSSRFSGKEFFLSDHVINQTKVVPGVVCLEMARAAVLAAEGLFVNEDRGMRIRHVAWVRPILVEGQDVEVHIELNPVTNNEIKFEITTDAYDTAAEREQVTTETLVHCEGSIELLDESEGLTWDLQELKNDCRQKRISAHECYSHFEESGIHYGEAHQGIKLLEIGRDCVLAQLVLPEAVVSTLEEYVLHPSLLDAALQATLGLYENFGRAGISHKPALPFALDALEVFKACRTEMWAVVRPGDASSSGSKIQKFDIDLCDEHGEVCVRLKGFSSREMQIPGKKVDALANNNSLLLLTPHWLDSAGGSKTAQSYCERHVILCELDNQASAIRAQTHKEISEAECHFLGASEPDNPRRYHRYVRGAFEVFQSLIQERPAKPLLSVRYESYVLSLFRILRVLLEKQHKGQVLLQLLLDIEEEPGIMQGLSALLKTAQEENPKLVCQVLVMNMAETQNCVSRLLADAYLTSDKLIRYTQGVRQVPDWKEVNVVQEVNEMPWQQNKVYLISGGAGGLGLLFAQSIVESLGSVTLILLGRSDLSEAQIKSLKSFESHGAKVEYRKTDITQVDELRRTLNEVANIYGGVNGVLHSAGLIRDNFIVKKEEKELLQVLAPKVHGIANLDEATKGMALDFFIAFSSLAGVLGNVGQADYAAANGFMDGYMTYRRGLVEQGQRQGLSLSINWPLWASGGMQIDASLASLMTERSGLVSLQTDLGLHAFKQLFSSKLAQGLVMVGERQRIKSLLAAPVLENQEKDPNQKEQSKGLVASVKTELSASTAEDYLKQLLSSSLKLPLHRIDTGAAVEQYGLDSVMVMEMTNELEKVFGTLPKTLFFEYQTLEELADYFQEHHAERLQSVLEDRESIESASAEAEATVIELPRSTRTRRKLVRKGVLEENQIAQVTPLDISIIGVAGRYPQASNLETFWDNLKNGRDCITEVPSSRWDHNQYFDEDKDKPGKTYSKWGGFIDGVDEFDPLFFNISPRDAISIDPQERLFLQCVYEAIENAGYTRSTLSKDGNVDVYVGVMYEEYQLYGTTGGENAFALPGSASSVANRVSYFCDFHGASMAVDTMCSSSLTTVHLACRSLHRGDCEVAVAGGVNVSVHPNKYLLLAQGNFVSSKGRCESFGLGGDGYVPGEGVGAVLLKPLAQAITDGDQVLAVIKGTALNHGGKTRGYSVPNPNAQASLIEKVFRESGIDPRTVSYLEAHGTGTSLGDPIEIAGMNKAFMSTTSDREFCAIGSVKSNIGHCESAAGIAALTKVLLQMKHRQLAPSLHSKELNPYINFNESPFTVQQVLADWKRPVIESDGVSREYPRRAGISSFGAGGSNAHLLIEEYTGELKTRDDAKKQCLIILSAKSADRLQQRVRQLLEKVESPGGHAVDYSDADLIDIAYTLQLGREAMPVRLGILVDSIKELREKLTLFLNEKDSPAEIYFGEIKPDEDAAHGAQESEALQEQVDDYFTSGQQEKLLECWIKGIEVDWRRLYTDDDIPRRISLPNYPFVQDKYWIDAGVLSTSIDDSSVQSTPRASLNEDSSPNVDRSSVVNIQVAKEKTAQRHSIDSIRAFLKQSLADTLFMSPEQIGSNVQYVDMGMDSISGLEWIKLLNKNFNITLKATAIYDYPTLNEFAQYLSNELSFEDPITDIESLENTMQHSLPDLMLTAPTTAEKEEKPTEISLPPLQAITISDAETDTSEVRKKIQPEGKAGGIAIIGMSGRYPGASELSEFWSNLAGSVNSIVEIPKARWNVEEYYDPTPGQAGKMYCKWLGALDDIACFDPMFFNISPLEALAMDPQHRLFLQEGYRAFEDAGYGPTILSGLQCGVYLGVMNNEYSQLLADNGSALSATGNSYAIGAARLAYYLNLKGPAIPLDTACSSSLVGLHLACQALWNGEIELALVGGVTLYLVSESYLGMCAAGMLSSSGQCRAFDNGADGFVPGEGVGCVVLKPLHDAERDGDHIYGVVLGTGINQDGKTNGMTAPSMKSQMELELEVYRRHDIDPHSISYAELHGTGTALGDPIELEALSIALGGKQRGEACAIGSVKSNIGHTSAAAGIASVHKVLLSMQHKQLVPTLNYETPNEHFDFANSGLQVNTDLREWDVEPGQARRACVSSFGFSGTNAHVVIEEYEPPHSLASFSDTSCLVVFSALDQTRLKELVKRVSEYIASNNNIDLKNVAYTLQVGRAALNARLALVVNTIDDLLTQLNTYLSGNHSEAPIWTAEIESVEQLVDDEDVQELVDSWWQKGKFEKVAALWVKGTLIDWGALYGADRPGRVSLPTYPFARERYWVEDDAGEEGRVKRLSGIAAKVLHPLLHENTSTLSEQSFRSVFSGEEFFLKDHMVMGERVLPGVAYLEMARAAVTQALGLEDAAMLELSQVAWLQPLSVGESQQAVHISLVPETEGRVAYQIYSLNDEQRILHSQGWVVTSTEASMPRLPLDEIRARCAQRTLPPAFCYEHLQGMGIVHGPSHQGIKRLHVGSEEVLAELVLPEDVLGSESDYVLHPSMLDSALQASLALLFAELGEGEALPAALPFALESVRVYGRCERRMWAHLRYSAGSGVGEGVQKLDIDLCDAEGVVCVSMQGFSSRSLDKLSNTSMPASDNKSPMRKLRLAPLWEASEPIWETSVPSVSSKVVIVGGSEEQQSAIQTHYPEASLLALNPFDSIEEMTEKLTAAGEIDHLFYVCAETDTIDVNTTAGLEELLAAQDQSLLGLFRFVKALLSLDYGSRELAWTFVTTSAQRVVEAEDIDPVHAGVHGFVGSLAKEYSHWWLRLVDMDSDASLSALLPSLLRLGSDKQGEAWAYRHDEWYRQRLLPTDYQESAHTLYKEGGVYVVIGGAGGVGWPGAST